MGANRAEARGRGRGALVLAVAVVLGGLALVPAPARATADAEAPSPARLETFELPSDLVDPASAGGRLEDRRRAPQVHVLLPAGYVHAPDRDYPVLWLLHGADLKSTRLNSSH